MSSKRAALLAWAGPVLAAIFAGVLRFDRLGIPGTFTFDETNYAKDAWSLLRFGTERRVVPGADTLIYQGHTDIFAAGGNVATVHPPVGKWMIAAGEQLFGLTRSAGASPPRWWAPLRCSYSRGSRAG